MLKLYSITEKSYVDTSKSEARDKLMKLAGISLGMGYEGFGMQDDSQPVIFDKCGNFGCLDAAEFQIHVSLSDISDG